MKKMKRLIGVPLVLGSLVALFAMADAAMATHTTPVGATPFRVPLVPSFAPCETGASDSFHGPPLNFPSCNPPVLTSGQVKIGTNAVGFARIVVCPVGTTLAFCYGPAGGATAESGGQCSNATDDDGDGRVNDGCPTVGAAVENPVTQCANATDDDADGTVNDGCPIAPLGTPFPDVRLTGSGRDIQCNVVSALAGCPSGTVDYNPNGTAGPYTPGSDGGNGTNAPQPYCNPDGTSQTDCIAGTDVTATAELATSAATIGGTGNFAGHAIRVSDHYNCDPTIVNPSDPNFCPADDVTSTRPATMTDLQFPVAVDCLPQGSTTAAPGSTCGVNTTANALVPGAVIPNKSAVVEIGEVILKDAGPNGVAENGGGDDDVFAVQGIFLP